MANVEQVAMLKRSVEEWNHWRYDNPEKNIDFTCADLSELNLINANFSAANLSKADLSNSILVEAKFENAILLRTKLHGVNLGNSTFFKSVLIETDFSGAKINDAIFVESNLTRADFFKSNLSGSRFIDSNFYNASLIQTDLSFTEFESCDLKCAIVSFSIFNDIDLSCINGLSEITHNGPSFLNTTTFQKSKGQIALKFLKGCGLSDWEIESIKLYNPKLSPREVVDIIYKIEEIRNSKPIQLIDLFLSYSHKDHIFIDELEKYLGNNGIRFWRDIHDATAGRLDKIVARNMRNRIILLVFSESSIKSDWVEFEIENARQLEKEQSRDMLCPIALDDNWKTCSWSPILMNQIKRYKVLDFSEWQNETIMEKQFKKLLKGLNLYYTE